MLIGESHMQYEKHRMKELNIAYLGGGSRGWAWTFMMDLALEPELCGEIRLFDIDTKAAKKNEIIGNQLAEQEGVCSRWNYRTTNTYEEALVDADFVIISILPGDFNAMEVDVHLPERDGVYQSVGDTAGPGGTIRAMRTIPAFVEFANRIKQYCPKAWVINYTNPMAICIRTLYETFPEIKAFGCCHEVFGTQEVLKTIYESADQSEEIKRSDIHVNVVGVNHFTWFTQASYRGMDLFPVYEEYIRKHYEEGLASAKENWMNSSFACAHRVKFDLYLKYGAIAAAGDRHLVEFLPCTKYLKDKDTVASWKFGLTSVAWRKKDLQLRLARSERLVSGEEQMELKPSGEEGIALIKALCGLTRKISNVNLPNYAHQIPNLPESAIVETNAIFEKNQVRPIYAGPLPDDLYELILPHVMNQQRIYKAAITYDPDLVAEAMLHDPLIKDYLSKSEIFKLSHDMLEGTKQYLPKQWEL